MLLLLLLLLLLLRLLRRQTIIPQQIGHAIRMPGRETRRYDGLKATCIKEFMPNRAEIVI